MFELKCKQKLEIECSLLTDVLRATCYSSEIQK